MLQINPNNIQKYNCHFGSKNTPQMNTADEYLAIIKEGYDKQFSPSFVTKIFGLPTLAALSSLGLTAYFISLILPNIKKNKKTNYGKSTIKKFLIASIIYVLVNLLGTTIANKYYDRYLKQQQDYFKSINQTHAKLSDKILVSSDMEAFCDACSGNILMNRTSIIDPLKRLSSKYFLKHELVHAKQFELIARSKDGIKKLNYACMKNYVKKYAKIFNKNNSLLAELVNDIYNDIISEKTDKYDNIKTYVGNTEVNFKKLITAMYTLIHDKNADMNSIPIVIDSKHYQNVINSMPPLTAEENKQAEKYYQAFLEYPIPNFFEILNPFSAYYNNLLEKEANKKVPWWTRII